MKRILSIFIILLTILSIPSTAWGYLYNEPHSFQSQIEQARLKTVAISIWKHDKYAWAEYNSFLGCATGTMIGKGLLLTNAHVIVDGQNDITIKTYLGEVYKGTLLSIDKSKDLALVSFEYQAAGFTLSTTEMYKGKPIMTVGQPVGFPQWSFSEGTIQTLALDYKGLQNESYTGIQTDAQVISGNSGGPLLDSNGELVGIIRATDGVYSYAVRLEDIKTFLEGIE